MPASPVRAEPDVLGAHAELVRALRRTPDGVSGPRAGEEFIAGVPTNVATNRLAGVAQTSSGVPTC